MSTCSKKLYIVVRGDLEPGLRAAQGCHALRQFVEEHPDIDRKWFDTSNTLVLLEVPDIEALGDLAFNLDRRGIRFSRFIEPDLDNEVTALAIAPEGRSLCNRIPLAFNEGITNAA